MSGKVGSSNVRFEGENYKNINLAEYRTMKYGERISGNRLVKKGKAFLTNQVEAGFTAFKQALFTIRRHWIRSLAVAAVFILGLFLIGLTPAFFISFFLLFLLMGFDSRVPLGLALLCLLACPFLLIFNSEQGAEQLAIWVFGFLVIGIILQFVDLYMGGARRG